MTTPTSTPQSNSGATEFAGPNGVFEQELAHIRRWRRSNATDADLLGLAISGGGIRSATFGLGVLQALAETGLLGRVDYLSTVSGGGYIGSWLTAWIKAQDSAIEARRKAGEAAGETTGAEEVRKVLRTPAAGGRSVEAVELRKLRAYSNYLSPNPGLFSADTWTVAAIWARNMLVNLVLLVCLMAVVLLVPRFFLIPLRETPFGGAIPWAAWLIAAALGFVPVYRIVRRSAPLPGVGAARGGIEPHSQKPAIEAAVWLLGSAYLAGIAMWNWGAASASKTLEVWPAVVIAFGCVAILWLFARGPERWERLVAAFVVSGLAAYASATVLHMYLEGLGTKSPGDATHVGVLVPPAILLICAMTMAMATGIMGNCVGDQYREWLGRLGAWVLIVTGVTLVLWLISFHGLLWFGLAGGAVRGWLGAGWAMSAIAAVVGGWSAKSSGTGTTKSGRLEWVLAIAPHVFVVGLATMLSAGLGWLLSGMPAFSEKTYWQEQESISTQTLLLSALALGIGGFFLSMFIDINEFSMHYLYRNRLVRCYLGASRFYRNPNQLTDFDPDDDIPMNSLSSDYSGPYPLINAALNLSNPDPGQRERRSTNFVFAPLLCGYQVEDLQGGAGKGPGGCYRPTAEYAKEGSDGERGVNLGMAFTISGAAATPNMGSHTSAPLAFLMTIFNVRLGWWIGNPAGKSWRRAAPKFGLMQLVGELLAMADIKSDYVYLSDGGHFENLAVYELLRRRCRFIIACDGSQDEKFRFDDLGGLVRKARSDFGIEIELDTSAISERDKEGYSTAHCAAGSIRYPEGFTGTLLYIKSTVTGDEDTDVLQYRSKHAEFPHQTTGDQFFSESQFESYRKLGHHAARESLQPALQGGQAEPDTRAFFLRLRQSWMGTPDEVADHSGRHSVALNQLMLRLSEDPELRFLDAQFYPEWRQVREGAASQRMWWPAKEEDFARAFYFCQALVHLMEQVYTDLNLQRNYDHPICRGWMNRFMHWSGSDMFRLTYAVTSCTFDGRFQKFCERNLYLAPASVRVSEAKWPDDKSNFNEFEMDMLNKARNKFPEWKVWQFELDVIPLFSGAPRSQWTYTVGFALTEREDSTGPANVPPKLVWIRVQNHLRAAGIGRKAIEKLHEACGRRLEVKRLDRDDASWLFEAESDRHSDWVTRVLKGMAAGVAGAASAATNVN